MYEVNILIYFFKKFKKLYNYTTYSFINFIIKYFKIIIDNINSNGLYQAIRNNINQKDN